MLAGECYDSRDPELIALYWRARQFMQEFQNAMAHPGRMEILRCVLGELGAEVWIEPPFVFEYGPHISIGARTYLNSGVFVQDCARVHIGQDGLIGPGVKFCTASHPLDSRDRIVTLPDGRTGYRTSALPIHVGDRCWIGADVTVLGGVTIGDDAVIGAGSLVTRDVPPGTLALGTPARVIRPVTTPG
jgi:maltose O-acetyltransferase